MTLTEFRYVVAVAREHHFGRAAESCFVSQPTLSVAVKKLEDELGVVLFERGGGEVTPTPVGARIVEQAMRVLEQADEISRIAARGKDPLAGPLRVGAIFTIAPYLLPRVIPVLRRKAPAMPLVIEEDYTANLAARLKNGDLDVIVISLPFQEPGLAVQAVYEEPFVVALPSEHRWRDRKGIDAQELSRENLLLLGAGHCFRDQVLQACPDCQRSSASGSLQRTLEGGSLETIRQMVATGAGITVLPCTSVGTSPTSDRLTTIRSFRKPVPVRQVALAWRRSFPRREAVETFRQAMLHSRLPCVTFRPQATAEEY
ncbi:MAG: LysR substrate-binding domain-containing protein [Gammaproteobacteria bacterium]